MDTINEGSTAIYTASVTGPDGVVISSFSAIYLTLYDEYTGNIINDRHDQDVNNANNVVISLGGQLTWHLQPEDTVIVTNGKRGEWHIALFVFEWPNGRYTHRVRMRVVNMPHEPASLM